MKNKFNYWFLLILLIQTVFLFGQSLVSNTTGSFVYTPASPLNTKPITVYYRIPAGDISTMPILFAFHGDERNGSDYRDYWISMANANGFMVFAPEYSEAHYPGGDGYQLGNVFVNGDNPSLGTYNASNLWTFSTVDPLFEDIKVKVSGTQQTYEAWGHSGGAQFLQRFRMYLPNSKLNTAVCSNAGWYTVPESAIDYPYGLNKSQLSNSNLSVAFSKKQIVHLGLTDTDPNSVGLRHNTTVDDQQGLNRLVRGQYFFSKSQTYSQSLGSSYNWQKAEVTGVGHDPQQMANDALKYLFVITASTTNYSSIIDGGFENQATGNIQAGSASAINLSPTAWSANTTPAASITRAILGTGGRTGPQCASFGSGTTAQKTFYTPQIAGLFAPNTKYQIQFYYKPTTTTATLDPLLSTVDLYVDNTSATAALPTPGAGTKQSIAIVLDKTKTDWTKVTGELTTNATAAGTSGVAAISFKTTASSTNFTASFDDFVIYQGNLDTLTPSSPGAITATGASNGGANVSWGAATSVDGGGYVVVRYATSAPSESDDVVQNGIYKFNNAIGAGVVRYTGTNLSFLDDGLSPGVNYYYKVYTVDKAFNYSDENVSGAVQALATTYYYNGTGLLTNLASWDTDFDGIGTTPPTNFTDPSQVFEIRNTTAVTLDGVWTIGTDPVNGTKVRLGNSTPQAAVTLTLNPGASIGPSGTGNFDVMAPVSGGQKIIYKGTTAISFGNIFDDNLEVTYDGVTITSATTKSFGTVSIINSANVTFSDNPVIKNIVVDATSTLVAPTSASAYITIPEGGSLIVYGTVKTPKLTGFISSNVGTPGAAFGDFQFIGAENVTLEANSTVEYVRTASGAQTVNARTDYKNLILSGSTPKTINGPTTIAGTLTVNQATTTSAVTLTGNVTINGTVSFVLGKITTGVNTLTIGTSGSIAGADQATGWVDGNLKKLSASNTNPSYIYAIGDATNYLPLELTFTENTSAAGGITAKMNTGDHVQIADASIDATKSVNRNWTLTNDGLTGFGAYSAKFGYASIYNDTVATPANYVVRLYNGSAWSIVSTTGTPTDILTTATGITGFGDFIIGECVVTTNASATIFQVGSSYTWATVDGGNGQNYTASTTQTVVTGCNVATLNLTIIPTSYGVCKGATVGSATAGTPFKFYKDVNTTTAAYIGTQKLAATTYYVSSTPAGLATDPRFPVTITLNNLPTTPSALTSTESGLICKYIGSPAPVTFNATATGASSYIWTAPTGAVIVPDGGQAEISFQNVSAIPGPIGSVTVKIVDANGCVSLPKALALTTKLPTAPTSLTLTSTNNTPHFKGAAVVPATVPVSYTSVGLDSLLKITKVGPYMGTETVFTMAAPAAVTAASYLWTLPTGVNAIASETVAISSLGVVTSTSPVITANFAGVTPGTTALPIVVQSVAGCGNSTNRTLSLARSLPTAPTALVLTNTSETILEDLTKITKVGPYTGTNIDFTLTATPFTTQGATATSYAWVLPEGVEIVSDYTNTEVSVTTVVATVPTTVVTPAFKTDGNTITIRFSGFQVKTTGSLLLSVYAVNGSGNSIARTLVLARAVPTAPTKLVLTEGLSTTAITKVSAYTAKDTSLTLTATPFATQGAEATSFSWVLPAGVNVTAGATNLTIPETDVNGNKTWTGTSSVLTINFEGTGATSIPLSVYAVNGAGTSSTVRTLTVTSAVPTAPAIVGSGGNGTATQFGTCLPKTYTATLIPGATYNWTVPGNAPFTGGNGNVIVVDYSGTTLAIGLAVAVTCSATNGTGTSGVKSLTVKRIACVTPPAPAPMVFNVVNNSSVAYIINGTDNNPTLTLTRGLTYTFNISASGHPFFIKTTSSTGTGNAYNLGVTNNGIDSGTITFVVDANAPSQLFYNCQYHGSQAGLINIVNPTGTRSAKVSTDLNVIAYPNPSSSEFTIESSAKGAMIVKVYDMQGRLIENRQATSNSVQVGSRYAAGTYNVIVNQGANTKSVRVIKK